MENELMKNYKRFLALAAVGCMALSLAACGSSNSSTPSSSDEGAAANSEPIQIATKPMTEQYILGEMLKQIIEAKTDYTCEVTEGIAGGTNNIMPAMESGEFDLYPEYTSSGYVMVLGHNAKGVSDDEIWDTLLKEYHENLGMTWVGQYGFNNTFCVTVRGDIARQYDLKTCSDLAAVSDQVVFGGNPDYIEREDGYPVLCETYGFNFKDTKSIDIGVKYAALENGDIDVTNGFTTDAQLGVQDVVVLEDDKHLQVNYFCSTVVREDTLAAYPGLEDALMLMDGLLSDTEMAQLNYKVEVEEQDEADVAHAYLVEKGVLDA